MLTMAETAALAGRVAYLAFQEVVTAPVAGLGALPIAPWEQLPERSREAWQAAAQAVLAALQPDGEPSDEDRIRDAMAEAQDHPGRTVTR